MIAALGLAATLAAAERPASVIAWRLRDGRVQADAGAPAGPQPVGSLVKPFLAEAWARSHPGAPTPRAVCDRDSGCWKPSGHGALGLGRALALSCNAYFEKMAAETPSDELRRTLREAGFVTSGPLSPQSALGLGAPEDAPAIAPAALLRAYARLVSAPWSVGEPVRRELLTGLRESARLGTARRAGAVMGKTGTVPSLRGAPLQTSGWALVIDASGAATLGLVFDGTGRDAAAGLGGRDAEQRFPPPPWGDTSECSGARPARGNSDAFRCIGGIGWGVDEDPAPPNRRVRVQLLDALRPQVVIARNAGVTPVSTSRGFLGPGASVGLRPGDRLGDSVWELRLPGTSFRRRIRGRLQVDPGAEAHLRLRAEVSPAEYVGGVLLAELPEGSPALRLELGAAILRFLAHGPRHDAADVCDRTHCTWFVGRGPRIAWPAPTTPVLFREPGGDGFEAPSLDAPTWARIAARAREPGPDLWSSDCGGVSLSAHFVWGNGDRRVWSCPRHPQPVPWSRDWDDHALARAFGARVASFAVETDDGVWTLHARTAAGETRLRFDDAHRKLTEALGAEALPSPAARVSRITDGFRADGYGHGHRVGLCLAN